MKKLLTLLFMSILALAAASCAVGLEDGTKSVTPVFKIDGELPEIGEFSGKADRFYEEYTPDFIPSDEYGKIVPYVGKIKMFSTGDSDGFEQKYISHGFCTPGGKIVMDASFDTNYIGHFKTDDGFEYYTVSKSIEQKEDAPDEFNVGIQLVVPTSGEWCITVPKGGWVSSASNGVIVTTRNFPNGISTFNIYDYDGNEISEISGRMYALGEYSQGMFGASTIDADQYYLDINGNKVLGPYRSTSDFTSEGVAYVECLDGLWRFIDTEGNYVSREYAEIYLAYGADGYESEVFVARHADDEITHDIVDRGGRVLGAAIGANGVGLSFPEGDIVYNYTVYDSGYIGTHHYVRLSDGGEVFSEEYGVSPNTYPAADNLYINLDEDEKFAVLMDVKGETVATIEDFGSFFDLSANEKYFIYSSGRVDYSFDSQSGTQNMTDTTVMHIYDTEKGCEVFSLEISGYADFVGENDRYALFTSYEPWSVMGGVSRYYLYDTEIGKLVFDGVDYISYRQTDGKEYFSVCDGSTASLYDGKVNLILKMYNE